MAFVWKEAKDIWKGEGIYHLTYAVTARQPLLGTLAPIKPAPAPAQQPFSAPAPASVLQPAAPAPALQPSSASVLQPAQQPAPAPASQPAAPAPQPAQQPAAQALSRSYSQGVERPPLTNGASPKFTAHKAMVELTPLGLELSRQLLHIGEAVDGAALCAKQVMPDHVHVVLWLKKDTGRSIRQIGNGFRIGMKRAAINLGVWSQDKGHVLEIPFIRTLSHSGQLHQMIDYVHANPDSAWERRQNPQYYTIRRNINRYGLTFDAMGKVRLLDYPERNVVALSRSLTPEQIQAETSKALFKAKMGCVTYTAAINEGEKAVSKAIRQAGYPLVIMMLDGFPAEGTEAARYFHPSGVYHTACGEGKLLLLAPHQANYNNDTLIANTDKELEQKAQQKGQHYHPIPHTSQRWQMIAGNTMLKMLSAEREESPIKEENFP